MSDNSAGVLLSELILGLLLLEQRHNHWLPLPLERLCQVLPATCFNDINLVMKTFVELIVFFNIFLHSQLVFETGLVSLLCQQKKNKQTKQKSIETDQLNLTR